MDVWERVPKRIQLRCQQIRHARQFSEDVIQSITTEMKPVIEKCEHQLALVFAGSFGRKEAAETSDVDAFVLFKNDVSGRENIAESLLLKLEEFIKELNQRKGFQLRMASQGAFSNSCVLENLVINIGGHIETNHLLTQRISLLVEGQAIGKGVFFKSSRKAILMKYLKELQPIERRPIFLMNDLARYYRTTCVDYEYKKNEVGKPWAVRLIKLRHSRKLFYFSALFPLLESMALDMDPRQKLQWIQNQFIQFNPLERLILLLDKYGKTKHWEMLIQYNTFLELLASKERRRNLDTISFRHRKDDKEYLEMRDNAREFRQNLLEFMFSIKSWRENIEKYVIC